MSSPAFFAPLDEEQRRAALDPTRSFAVQAPAGSGKTELLIQRFLRLMATVQKPEAIVAITFTRKAAGEMLERILAAFRAAQTGTTAAEPHEQLTLDLASAALARDRELGWDVLSHPGRLRVQTIDALCASIAGDMPWLARLGAMPRIEEDTRRLYDEAARRTVLMIGSDSAHREPLETLLEHLDNNAERAQQLIAAMLATRDQWLALVAETDDDERAVLEEAMSRVGQQAFSAANRLIPHDAQATWLALAELTEWPASSKEDEWARLIDVVLTKAGTWRKRVKGAAKVLIDRFADIPGLLEALEVLRVLPPPSYTDERWQVIRALLHTLKLAVAKLREVFREEGMIDFCELGIAARQALGSAENPTDLAFRWDARIEHLLVDEFQDTSRSQLELVEQLTREWQPGDGRTLFLVGDPMQSIYRFREAEVGIFLEAQQRGIGQLPLETLALTSNYRSAGALVERVTQLFSAIFPLVSDIPTGAATFSESRAIRDRGEEPAVELHAFGEGEDQLEGETVLRIIRETRRNHPADSIAILVRARPHLPHIVRTLKRAQIRFRAVEIDSLAERAAVRDLLALTRAMLHLGDRISWLAILRAPWCGLSLADLEVLVRGRSRQTVWDLLGDLGPLSGDGQMRAARVVSVLGEAFAERGRWPLRRWIERAWIGLGGPACLEGTEEGDESGLEDAAAYLDLLEAEQAGADLADFDYFQKRVSQLFAQADALADETLQVMTIHKAKGLEFDTVIVPGLGRPERSDESRLFLFHDWREGNRVERMVAPITPTGEDEDPQYGYLREIDKRKNEFERVRQLYVAATRARNRLHFLGHAKTNKDGEASPDGRSMLADLWPALTDDERAAFRRNSPAAKPISPATRQTPLRRLPRDWTVPELPSSVRWEGAEAQPAELHEPTFEWVGESLRVIGTVVHAFLERARESLEVPAMPPIPPSISMIRRALLHSGLPPTEVEQGAQRVWQALDQMRASARARWILSGHNEARSEYAVTGVVDGEIVRGLIDRTFVDQDGVRWVIDFKTSAHAGGGREQFLDEQQRRYQSQMDRYARLLEPLGRPVRLGLYFPLLDAWREWAPGAA